MFGLHPEDIILIKNVMARYPDVQEAILFGSRAKGNQHTGSDIDIALKGTGLESQAVQISGELNDEIPLPYHFDIIALDTLENEALREHIHRVGISFYSK